MEFRILGPLEVVDDGRPVQLDRRLSRALLAYLLLHANEPVSSDRLVDQLWGESPPKSALASLQNTVSRLRKTIGADRIQLTAAGYILRVDPESFDLAQFERLVAEAKGAPPRSRLDFLRAALSLWRGAPLEDLAFEAFAESEIAVLNERYVDAVEERFAAELELGAGAELVGELEELVHEHPLRERFRAQLMLALYRADRQADALAAYADARATLRDELGLEPSEELRSLQRRILEQDPALRGGDETRVRSDSRRTVTVLFCDLVDSTRLATRLDAEAYRVLISTYFDAVRSAVVAHGGTVEKFIGDAVMALFGIPELHEDDAMRAVRAAVDARDAVLQLNETAAREWEAELAIRIALNTGEVLASEGATGAPINIAAHLEKRAGRNQIVLGAETHRLVRGAVDAEEIDLGDGMRAWRLDDVTTNAPVTRRLDAPLIGRKKELRRLRTAFQRAVKDERCVVATVVGEAGIGKTRLAREFVDSVRGDARIVVGRCVSYGAGATYLPIAEIVRSIAPEPTVAGVASLLSDDDDAKQIAQRVAELVGFAEGPAAPGETFWAVRRLFESLARERPLVVALDDIHWAEPTLLDLVEYLGEWAEGPIFVLCLARPELLEARPGWGGPTSTGFVVALEPLPPDDVGSLVESLAEGAVAPDIHEKIVAHAGGNPLFAEQLFALASEAPDVSLDQAPATVEALIASRLDRLPPTEHDVVQRASVVGRRFAPDDLDKGALAGLERRGLVHPTPDGYRFHHVLVRDVAYRGIPKARRAELHEHVAKRGGADEIVGFHYEQAYKYRSELAREDDHARELAQRGGEYLGAAGIRAWKRADAPAATNLLRRGASLVRADDPSRSVFLCELGVALRGAGDDDSAARAFADAIDAAIAADDRVAEVRARIELAHHKTHHGPSGSTAVADLVEIVGSSMPELENAGDHRALGRALLLVGWVEGNFHLRYAELERAAEGAIQHYQAAGWSASSCLGALMTALYYGPRRVDEAVERCERLLEQHDGDRASEANLLQWLGGLQAMVGRFEQARRTIDVATQIYESLGLRLGANDGCAMVLGDIELLAGRIDVAESHFRRACETCIQFNEGSLLASRAPQLADALYSLGAFDEATEWTDVARERADIEDLPAQAAWRGVAARLSARRGDGETALALIDEALTILDGGDGINQRAKLRLELAEVHALAARDDDSSAAVHHAVDLYEQKGNLVAADAARALLAKRAFA